MTDLRYIIVKDLKIYKNKLSKSINLKSININSIIMFINYIFLFQGISTKFTTLRLMVEKQLEEKQKLIDKFNMQLQKDIVILTEKLSEINDEVMVNSLISLCIISL